MFFSGSPSKRIRKRSRSLLSLNRDSCPARTSLRRRGEPSDAQTLDRKAVDLKAAGDLGSPTALGLAVGSSRYRTFRGAKPASGLLGPLSIDSKGSDRCAEVGWRLTDFEDPASNHTFGARRVLPRGARFYLTIDCGDGCVPSRTAHDSRK